MSDYFKYPKIEGICNEGIKLSKHQDFLSEIADFQKSIKDLLNAGFIKRELRKNPNMPPEEEYLYSITKKGEYYLDYFKD
jgi:predicted transcriptional regulator